MGLGLRNQMRLGAVGRMRSASAAPAAPVLSAATDVTDTSFTANWAAVAGATGYRLDVATNNFPEIGTAYVSGYEDKPVSGTSQSVTGLTAGTTYYCRVRAVNNGGASANSNTIPQETFQARTQTFINACTTKPDVTDANSLNTFVKALETAGVFAKLDDLKLLANWDTTGNLSDGTSTAFINLVDPTKYPGTKHNSPAGTKYLGAHNNGNTGNKILTGFNMATAGVKASRNDTEAGIIVAAVASEQQKIQLHALTSAGIMISRRWNDNSNTHAIRCNGNSALQTPRMVNPGIISISRTGSTTTNIFIDNPTTPVATSSVISQAVENVVVTLLSSGGTDTTYSSSDTLSMYYIGKALSDTERTALYNAAVALFAAFAGRI